MTTKPLLKWVGGKTQILDKVLNNFPDFKGVYYEPFLGGGSILFEFLTRFFAFIIFIRMIFNCV